MNRQEAIQIIKNNWPNGRHMLSEALEFLIPELKESEDERIRKWLIEGMKYLSEKSLFFGDIPKDRVIAWLEKQGEMKFPSLSEKEIVCLKRTLDFLREEHNSYTGKDFTNEIAVLEWLITHPVLVHPSELQQNQGEQKKKQYQIYERTKDRFYKEGVEDGILIGIKKQNPAWSEENSCYYDDICEILINFINNPTFNGNKDAIQKDLNWLMSVKESQLKSTWSEEDEMMLQQITQCLISLSEECEVDLNDKLDWLKSFKERVQPRQKQEWSEEDEQRIESAIEHLENSISDTPSPLRPYVRKDIDWLKSLKERYGWKPTDEQMKQLGRVAVQNKDNMIGKELMSLYQDLQKLREE